MGKNILDKSGVHHPGRPQDGDLGQQLSSHDRRMAITCARLDSPIGPVWVASTDEGICKVALGAEPPPSLAHAPRHIGATSSRGDPKALAPALIQLQEYFAGIRRAFDLPLDVSGTGFQQAVWGELAHIPYGKTATYGEIAQRIGKPRAARAVGAAAKANPLPIIIPCHRMIGADGTLTGYGAGLALKEALLRLEGAYPLRNGKV